jgi:hypothetical protein
MGVYGWACFVVAFLIPYKLSIKQVHWSSIHTYIHTYIHTHLDKIHDL